MLYIIKLPILVKFMQYDKQIYGLGWFHSSGLPPFYVTIRSLHGVCSWHDRDYSRYSEFVNTINAFKWL